MVNTWRKCLARSGSGTKNVPGPDRIDLVPAQQDQVLFRYDH